MNRFVSASFFLYHFHTPNADILSDHMMEFGQSDCFLCNRLMELPSYTFILGEITFIDGMNFAVSLFSMLVKGYSACQHFITVTGMYDFKYVKSVGGSKPYLFISIDI